MIKMFEREAQTLNSSFNQIFGKINTILLNILNAI